MLRAIRSDFDPYEQVRLRLRSLESMGHPVDKVELLVMGGTFLSYPVDYQYWFVKSCYDALNEVESADLDEATRLNETARHRCVALCVETRPDVCGDEEVARLLEFGATRVELGVQTLDDSVHQLMQRGHGVAEIIEATSRLRRNGFKVYYHWMPGLPGSSAGHDLEMTRRLFDDPRFRPDGLKLYPTVVVQGSKLEEWYDEGRFNPCTIEEMTDLLARMKMLVPPYVRIARLMRDIPRKFIVAGCDDLALRSTVRERMRQLEAGCQCVRCREYGHRRRDGWVIGQPVLRRLSYETADGDEVLLSYEDKQGTLYALLRLSIGGPETEGSTAPMATVRELHVYGPEVALGKRDDSAAQHRGLGASLLREAERIAVAEYGADRLRVLSGVGARGYYRQLGYERQGPYMVKPLAEPSY